MSDKEERALRALKANIGPEAFDAFIKKASAVAQQAEAEGVEYKAHEPEMLGHMTLDAAKEFIQSVINERTQETTKAHEDRLGKIETEMKDMGADLETAADGLQLLTKAVAELRGDLPADMASVAHAPADETKKETSIGDAISTFVRDFPIPNGGGTYGA